MEPNHHGDLPGFSGIGGTVAGLTMLVKTGTMVEVALDRAQITQGSRALDIGSGPGSACRAAAKRGATVHGVDPAGVMRSLAARLTRGEGVTYLDGGAERQPFDDDTFDAAWSIRTVHHWPDLAGGIAETCRVLKPGGRFVVVERETTADATGIATHGWIPQQAETFVEMCLAAGFTDATVESLPNGRQSVLVVTMVATART